MKTGNKTHSGYNAELDIWRFVFSVAVFLFHLNKMKLSDEQIFPLGYVATDFFFMVSGYLMASSSQRVRGDSIGESTYSFIKKKIVTLYPYVISSFAVAFFALQFFTDKPVKKLLYNLSLSYPEMFLFKMSGIKSASFSNGPGWYISAMLIAMIFLFPLLLKFKKSFLYIAAPLFSLFLYAYLSRNFSSLNLAENWNGFVTAGLLRGIAGLCLGCVCFAVCGKINDCITELTFAGKLLLFLLQAFLTAVVFFIMINGNKDKQKDGLDYEAVFLLFVFLIIVFSKKTGISDYIPEKVSRFLGKFSLPFYLNHRIFTRYYVECSPEWSNSLTVVLYVLYSVVVSLVMMAVIEYLRGFNKKHKETLKKLFVKR